MPNRSSNSLPDMPLSVTVVQVLEPAEAGAMTGHVRRLIAADGQRSRSPQRTGVLVADVDRLADGVADGVVGPWCQLVLSAVARPGVAGP